MKNLKKHIGLLVIAMIAYTGSVYAQFDDVYFDPSKDQYAATSLASNRTSSNVDRAQEGQSYNYTRDNERPRMDDGQYAYDDDEYDYYSDDYAMGNHYFDDYAYTRRINRFHRNSFFYDPFMYDDFYMMSRMYGPHRFYNPYRYSGFFGPSLGLSLGFGFPYGFNSYFGYGHPMYYGSMYGRLYNPYRYGFYDPILAYNYGYGGYGYGGYYGSRYPYVYRNNVNHGERPVYYNNGARTSGAAGVVPVARDGRVQVRSSGNNDGYVPPTTRTSPRGEDRSNRTVRDADRNDGQKLSPRSSGTNTNTPSPRSNTYTPDRDATPNRVYTTPSRVERKPAGDRSTYTPRSTPPSRNYTPSNDSPRRTYTPDRSSTRRTYTPSRNTDRQYTPSTRSTRPSVQRSTPSRRSYTPSSSSGSSSSRSSGSSSSSSRRTSPR